MVGIAHKNGNFEECGDLWVLSRHALFRVVRPDSLTIAAVCKSRSVRRSRSVVGVLTSTCQLVVE